MERKKYTFRLEVIYEQVYATDVNAEGDRNFDKRLARQLRDFTDDNENVARHQAEKDMQHILRYGLKLKGGSIIQSVIPSNAIKQIGIVDFNKWQEEQEAMAAAERVMKEAEADVEAPADVKSDEVTAS